ncbi:MULTISPECIES: VOC family protein [Streptomyces]|uniref:Extradiol dioxygenase n=2 Tax=Streptomyces TaxID=1883 RepID=A0A2U9P9G7_STRAS|nr:VOC family protein [Streptomyces actuosus]AWT46449.1 extradiol dioxygenase [Streptomyces actuosus]MBM4823153.1 extradiol dioxygenase [Streptomyces actuosus]
MIDGVHVVLYSRDAEADRAFLRDVLGWPHVDAGNGWLIFRTPPAEAACHPADGEPSHELMLMCDDLTATVADLTDRGVEITGPTVDAPWGRLTGIRLPGGGEISLYEPRHPRP